MKRYGRKVILLPTLGQAIRRRDGQRHGLILLTPLLVLLAILVRVRLGGPVLFRQDRSGRRMKPFTILKFRTMNDACDTGSVLLPDAQRLTPFGKFLRAASIDELPELWNILKGDMSLIGPRPRLPQEVE